MTTMVERQGSGLLVPVDVDQDLDVDQAALVDEQQSTAQYLVPADGYTDRVRDLEAAAAEADRIRALPTARVLNRRQALAEADALAALDAADHARKLAASGAREHAELAARAGSAAAKRRLEADVDVRALALSRRRRRWTGIGWVVLVLAMAFTCVNVQRFAAAGAPEGSAVWLVAWGVDPLLSLLVVGLLLARGDLAVLGLSLGQDRGWRIGNLRIGIIQTIELGALLAVLLMNVSPELAPGTPWQSVCLHIVVPLAGMGAALALPIVQQHYAAAITGLYRQSDIASDTAAAGHPSDPINLPEHQSTPLPGEAELSAADRQVLADVRKALANGQLPNPPTGHAVYRRVMRGKGDKARAYRVAAAVAGDASSGDAS